MTEQSKHMNLLQPDWPAPQCVRALVTTRTGGHSAPPFDSFNLAEHVDDEPENVRKNRFQLRDILPSEPVWLNQVHSNRVVNAGAVQGKVDADGSFTIEANIVSVVMTADCLPVLVCNKQGNAVAALHAGWRGLLDGILEQGVEQLCQAVSCHARDLLVWLGPAIGPTAFEVGGEVREAFVQKASTVNPASVSLIEQCFQPANVENKWFADIYQLARVRLSMFGVENFYGGNYCTYNDKENFYSYRRDGKTGRMASLIWINK